MLSRKKAARRGMKKTSSKTGGFRTKQEEFWAGNFGNAYTSRNTGTQTLAGNIALFSRILRSAGKVRSAIEFGANRGLNLQALRLLVPDIDLEGVEINKHAAAELRMQGDVRVHHKSIFDFKPNRRFELALAKGVLIHINPKRLPDVYKLLYDSSSRLICLAEYYNPLPVSISYRGNSDVLFKRDFAGEILERYADLKLVDYGFSYHRDPNFPQDDITWFLLEKVKRQK